MGLENHKPTNGNHEHGGHIRRCSQKRHQSNGGHRRTIGKIFHAPKSKIRATRKMLLKNKLREGVREMNVVPGLHSTLVSIPKFANADYIAVFDKNKANIYDAKTTTITSLADPVIVAP